MNDLINLHDLWHLGALIVAVAVLKNDTVWIKKWMREHEKNDTDRFKEITDLSREQEHSVNNALHAHGLKIAVLEAKSKISNSDSGSFKT